MASLYRVREEFGAKVLEGKLGWTMTSRDIISLAGRASEHSRVKVKLSRMSGENRSGNWVGYTKDIFYEFEQSFACSMQVCVPRVAISTHIKAKSLQIWRLKCEDLLLSWMILDFSKSEVVERMLVYFQTKSS